jgi:predicted SAM-dependent methyltransferase
LEHFPVRDFDYYLYQIYTIMTEGAKLICVVPDMPAVVDELKGEFQKDHPDFFRIKRLTFELFNEGPHVFDRHALWSSEKSVPYYLEMENLFKVESVRRVGVDTSIVPDQVEVVAQRM